MRRMLARLPLLETVVLVGSLACIVFLTAAQQRRAQPVGNTYSTYDAAGGGMRAWYELLAREGSKVGRFEERLAFLGRDAGVFVVADQPFSLAAFSDVQRSDASALAAWVRAGGRLLFAGSGTFGAVASTELQLRTTEYPSRDLRPGTLVVANALRRFRVGAIAALGEERLKLHKNDRPLMRDRRGSIAVRYALGRGQVIQIVDGAMFRNASIGNPDNPRLAYALVALLGGDRSPVVFDEALHGYVAPEHWWQVLPRRFVIAVLLALLVLAVALIGAAIRLGPARIAEPQRAPNTAEYLDALATLMERGHAAHASLERAFASTRRLVVKRLGAEDERSTSSVAARIGRADLREALLDLDALASDLAPTNAVLVRGLALAYRLREEYGTDAPGR